MEDEAINHNYWGGLEEGEAEAEMEEEWQ